MPSTCPGLPHRTLGQHRQSPAAPVNLPFPPSVNFCRAPLPVGSSLHCWDICLGSGISAATREPQGSFVKGVSSLPHSAVSAFVRRWVWGCRGLETLVCLFFFNFF